VASRMRSSAPMPMAEEIDAVFYQQGNTATRQAVQYSPTIASVSNAMNFSGSSLTSGNPELDNILNSLTVSK
jgi:hypothetical protein